MLDTVLLARDRYLVGCLSFITSTTELYLVRNQSFMQKPDGLMFPDSATLFMAGLEDQDYKEEKINCMSLFYYRVSKHFRLIIGASMFLSFNKFGMMSMGLITHV